jgi:hypothetical protein
MNAARGGGGQPARGVAVGHLTESHPDRIVVGTATMYLRDRDTCTLPIGMALGVAYTEHDGIKYVDSVTPLSE